MRSKRILSTLALAALLAAPGLAQRGTQGRAQRPIPTNRGEIFQSLDRNHDGRLGEAERAAAREGLRQRMQTRRDESSAPAPRGRREGAEGADRRVRRGAPRVHGPLGRGLERRFGNGDGRVGPRERMRLRRFVERWRAERGGARGVDRDECPRGRRPRGGGEDF